MNPGPFTAHDLAIFATAFSVIALFVWVISVFGRPPQPDDPYIWHRCAELWSYGRGRHRNIVVKAEKLGDLWRRMRPDGEWEYWEDEQTVEDWCNWNS